ncbi:hypothetical protein T09_4318 [Trichinella sp. T9]|nr:hypothetical protein T09_4318 [Trichinella sp. T9]
MFETLLKSFVLVPHKNSRFSRPRILIYDVRNNSSSIRIKMSSFVMLVQNTRLACDPFFKLLSMSSCFASIALPRKCSFLAFATSIMMDSIQITETPSLSTKCWRQNLIRFLVCGLYKSQDDQLSYGHPMSIVLRS